MRRLVLIVLCLIMLFACCGCSSKADKAEIEALKNEIKILKEVNKQLEAELAMDLKMLAKSEESEKMLEAGSQEQNIVDDLAYVVEKDEIAKYITLKELYTEKQMRAIIAKEAGDFTNVYFFLPDAPRKQYATFVEDGILPIKEHHIAYFKKYGDRWDLKK